MTQQLSSCAACGGFSPEAAAACVHCDAALPARPPGRARRGGSLWRFLAGGGFMMTLAACYGVAYRPDHFPRTGDTDGDGSPVPADCDDGDAMRYPGGPDADGDGVDTNCDGVDGWRDPAVLAEPAAPAPAPTAPTAPTPAPTEPAPAPAPIATPP
jgi:hypothetical protein